jgi:hypothetical protein
MDGSATLADDVARIGTRFLIYPQPRFVPGYERPELVWVSTPPRQMRAGPANQRIYVVDPMLAKAPYQFPNLPPYVGTSYAPAEPGADGHFDQLETDSRQFVAADVFACVQRVLDIWENYVGREIPWFFADTYDRLEIIPHLEWQNAQSGFGYLELGEDDTGQEPYPFALNFDAIAHETGHLVLLGTLGFPVGSDPTLDFFAYHEAIADFVSTIGLLHFDTALDKILRRTKGNLLIMNELDRFAELADEKQIRLLSHSLKLSDVGEEVHDHSKPFEGALFDTLIDVFQLLLVERGLSALDPREIEDLRTEMSAAEIRRRLATSREDYEVHHFATKSALIDARDIVGEMLAQSWRHLGADNLSFRDAAEALVRAAQASRGRRFVDRINHHFEWREIL